MKNICFTALIFFWIGCNFSQKNIGLKSELEIIDLIVLDFEELLITGCALPNSTEIEDSDISVHVEKKKECKHRFLTSGNSILISPYFIEPNIKSYSLHQNFLSEANDSTTWNVFKSFLEKGYEESKVPDIINLKGRKSEFPVVYPKDEDSLLEIFRARKDKKNILGVITFSHMFFEDNFETCVVKARFSTSPKAGNSNVYLFKKKKGKWKLQEKINCCGIS